MCRVFKQSTASIPLGDNTVDPDYRSTSQNLEQYHCTAHRFASGATLYYFGIEFAGASAGVFAAGASGVAVGAFGMPDEPTAGAGAGAVGSALSITPPLTAPLLCCDEI